MFVNERMNVYLNSLGENPNEFLIELEKQAHENDVPVIRKEMQNLLRVLLAMNRPKRILEVGTAIGFSALFMCEYLSEDSHITTIENYEKRIVEAKKNIELAGRTEKITLLEGDAQKILEELNGSFDFIFMDAAKAQYISYLPHVTRLLDKGGLLLSDNVLQEGDIIESRFAVIRRNRTIHSRMREYLFQLSHSENYTTTILPIGDGAALSVRK